MLRERKIQIVRQALKQQGKNLGEGEYAFFCPKHDHRPDRVVGQLGLNIDSGKFHCWSCGFSGKNLLPILEKGSQEYREYQLSLCEKVEQVEKWFEAPVLPREFRSLSRNWGGIFYRNAVSYLHERGLSDRDIFWWKLGYCEDGEYRGRIVIPSFDDIGLLNFFTARAIDPHNSWRYKNGNFSKDIIFNDYMIDWRNPVTLVEGPFDSFKAGENSIPVLGSFLSPGTKLFNRIVLAGIDVFIAFDADAEEKQNSVIESLLSYGVTSWAMRVKGKKDVGEMSKDEFSSLKRSAYRISAGSDFLRWKVTS